MITPFGMRLIDFCFSDEDTTESDVHDKVGECPVDAKELVRLLESGHIIKVFRQGDSYMICPSKEVNPAFNAKGFAISDCILQEMGGG